MVYTVIDHPKCHNNYYQHFTTLVYIEWKNCNISQVFQNITLITLCIVVKVMSFQSILSLNMALDKQVSDTSSLPIIVKIKIEHHQHQHLLPKPSAHLQ